MNHQKIGRNDPCSCGSGKKYKQCCQHEQAVQQTKGATAVAAIQRAFRAALQHHQAGNLPQAEAIYHQILQLSPNHPDVLHLLGAIALQGGDIELAIKLTTRAIKANPSNPESYGNLGLALHEQGRLDEAAQNYRKALAIKPDYADAFYNLHVLLINRDDMSPAVQHMQRVLEIHPSDMDARFTLGMLLDYAGDADAATQQFDLVELGPAPGRARLDAWRYLKSAAGKQLPMTGSNLQTFRLGIEAAAIDGLVLEFGVRHGNTIRQIAALVDQQVHGFDSFEGLPEVWHHEPKGSYTTKGVIPPVPKNVKLHVGWFADTLPKFLEEFSGPVRFINIDCDIYSSTQTVLDLLGPRIVAGSVIVFDEYIGNEHWREDEFKAFQEAVAKYGWSYEYLCFSMFTKQVAVRIR